MKHLFFFFFLFVSCYSIAQAQNVNGSGKNIVASTSCLSEESRSKIFEELDANITTLGLNNMEESIRSVQNDLIFPLSMPSSQRGYFNFYGISAYVDHDPSKQIQDYNCLFNTYDGHKGTDYYTFPYQWYLYENDLVQVISAAPGTIILKHDGRNDTNCSPKGEWNAVYIQHADGSILWYGHLKSGSLTAKTVGKTVEAGEYLGIVASSGQSTGPHLHLEYYDKNKKLMDPYEGTCNNHKSIWKNQKSYSSPQVNAILTHNIPPSLDCMNEVAGLANVFYPGNDLIVGIYITDYVAKKIASTKIYRPDNTLYGVFDTYNNKSSFGWFWNSRSYILQESDPGGIWTVECKFNDTIYTHDFEYINELTSITSYDNSKIKVFPNPSKGSIMINGVDLDKVDYQIINNSGKIVQQSTLLNNEIILANSPNGLYYIRIKNKVIDHLEKFILKR